MVTDMFKKKTHVEKFTRVCAFSWFFLFSACASTVDIFPDIPLTTEVGLLEMPNPIAIAEDAANDQIIVVNSNVDFFFDQGSLMTIHVDASDPASPLLTATAVLATPNFGSEIAFDGANAFIPFREALTDSAEGDQILRYAVGAGSLLNDAEGTTGKNPFGITQNGGSVFVVSDDELDIFDTDLNLTETIDLTIASESDIDEASAESVERITVDNVNNRAFIGNRSGKIFVVDLDSNSVSHVIDGPQNSRGIAFDGALIYVVDGNPPALWVFNPSLLQAAESPPEEVDDSELLVQVIDLGNGPNGMALDVANNRGYVANSTDATLSVIDLTLFEEIERISLDEDDTGLDDAETPFGVAVGAYGGVSLVFVANFDSNNIAVINGETLNVVAVFP